MKHILLWAIGLLCSSVIGLIVYLWREQKQRTAANSQALEKIEERLVNVLKDSLVPYERWMREAQNTAEQARTIAQEAKEASIRAETAVQTMQALWTGGQGGSDG